MEVKVRTLSLPTSHSDFHFKLPDPQRSPDALLAHCARSAPGPHLRGDGEGGGMVGLSF